MLGRSIGNCGWEELHDEELAAILSCSPPLRLKYSPQIPGMADIGYAQNNAREITYALMPT
jgi:hypothetical protein